MGQGCILPITVRDSEQLRHSLKEPAAQRALGAAGDALGVENKYAYRKAVTYPLSNPDHPAHKVFVDYVLRNVQGNRVINEDYKRVLPKAIAAIAEQTPDVLGLVTPARGKGATATDKNLGHRTRGDGFAYELLGTAELIRRNTVSSSGSQSSNGGPELRLFNTDRLDLGVRFQAGYGRAGQEQGLFRPTSPRNTNRDRQTFEADLLIRRDDGNGSWHTLGVDFKHARTSKAYASNAQDLRSEVQAVVNGILTGDMGLEEFHFVTNGYFNESIKKEVEIANQALMDAQTRSGQAGHPRISLHENVQYPLA